MSAACVLWYVHGGVAGPGPRMPPPPAPPPPPRVSGDIASTYAGANGAWGIFGQLESATKRGKTKLRGSFKQSGLAALTPPLPQRESFSRTCSPPPTQDTHIAPCL